MITIYWKEIRENLKWAVLLMLGVGLCMAWTVYMIGYPRNWQTAT